MITNLAEQLTFIYEQVETWHKIRLSTADANVYHERLLMQGNIVTIVEDGVLKGYIEVWKINFEQLGRLLCGISVYVYDENITDGNIAYINNGWIAEDYQNTDMARKLEAKFTEQFKDCIYVARKRQKYSEAFKVYPMVK